MKKVFFYIVGLLFVIGLAGCSSKALLEMKAQKEAVSAIDACYKAYESPDWRVRQKAITDVAAFSPKYQEANNLLMQGTADPYNQVCLIALESLTETKPPSAFYRIADLSRTTTDKMICWKALLALSEYHDPDAAPYFALALRDNEWLIREAAIVGLLKIDDQAVEYASVPYIVDSLKDKNLSVRLSTLNNLKIQDKRIYQVISAELMNEKNENKITYMKALLKGVNGYKLDKLTNERLIKLLDNQNLDIKLLTFKALKKNEELSSTKSSFFRSDK